MSRKETPWNIMLHDLNLENFEAKCMHKTFSFSFLLLRHLCTAWMSAVSAMTYDNNDCQMILLPFGVDPMDNLPFLHSFFRSWQWMCLGMTLRGYGLRFFDLLSSYFWEGLQDQTPTSIRSQVRDFTEVICKNLIVYIIVLFQRYF